MADDHQRPSRHGLTRILRLYSAFRYELERVIHNSSDRELALLASRIPTFTSRNCGWAEYEAMRGAIHNAIATEAHRRSLRKVHGPRTRKRRVPIRPEGKH